MKVLVLGGTVFVSRAVAREFVERGHDVTCLVRSPDQRLPEGVRGVAADRTTGERAYDEVRATWDCVVDVATDPRFVGDATRTLAATTRHWTYVSSCSVYVDQDTPGADETRDVCAPLSDAETPSPENYGASKSSCEVTVRAALGDRAAIVRPGLIVGAGDPSDRGGYWPARFARDHEPVIVPRGDALWIQTIDVRDLAAWMVSLAQDAVTGTYNAVGDPQPFRSVIDECRAVAGHRGEVRAADDQWLLDQGVQPWSGDESLPLWIPRGQGFDGFTRRSNAAARRHGLELRPLRDTITDIVSEERARGLSRDRRAGLSAGKERELLDALAAAPPA